MSETEEPNRIVWTFLEGLPATIRESMYFILGGFLSGFTDPTDEQVFETKFVRERIHQALNTASGYGKAGSTIAIVSIIDFRFALPQQRIPELEKSLESKIGSMDLARAHFSQAETQWQQLRGTVLADQAIHEFFDRATRVSHPEPPQRTAS